MKETRKYAAGILAAVTLATLSVCQAQTTNFLVDGFDPAGHGTNVYSSDDMISNVWYSWFGDALQAVQWDPNNDASNIPSSGSMKITALFDANHDQFLVFNGFGAFTPGLNALQWTNFQCDVKFDPSSPTSVNGGVTNFGHLQFCTDTGAAHSYGQDYFGGVDAVVSNYTSWTHLSFTLNAITDTTLTNIDTVGIHIDGPYYTPNLNGTTILWVDNIQFFGSTNLAITARPVVQRLLPATHALHFLAGDTSEIYMRENIATVSGTDASWYDNDYDAYPVTYSITITNFPAMSYSGYEYHMFLIPTASLPSGYGGDAYGNSYVDWDASNLVSLRIVANVSNYVGILAYKVNLTGNNPNNSLATITNSTATGTWTVTFNDNDTGTLTKGTNSASFTIPDPDAATFANPLVAYFGVQAQATNNENQAVDVSQIAIEAGSSPIVNDSFSSPSEYSLDTTGTWTIVASIPNCIWLAPPGARYWMSWTVPEDVYTPVVSTNLTLGSAGFVDPAVYDGNNPVTTALIETNKWALLVSNNIPQAKNVFLAVRKPASTP
jgi:hypothetical protein